MPRIASIEVPRPGAVPSMNWIRPEALEIGLRALGSSPLSKLITAIRYSGLVSRRLAMASTSRVKAGVTLGLPRTFWIWS